MDPLEKVRSGSTLPRISYLCILLVPLDYEILDSPLSPEVCVKNSTFRPEICFFYVNEISVDSPVELVYMISTTQNQFFAFRSKTKDHRAKVSQ